MLHGAHEHAELYIGCMSCIGTSTQCNNDRMLNMHLEHAELYIGRMSCIGTSTQCNNDRMLNMPHGAS